MEHPKRIIWLDLLKALAIFFVIWGHVIHHCGLSIHDYTSVCGWIYSFHMPLFMTLSGFVSVKLLYGEGSIIRKFNQLIVPCIVLYLFCLLIGHRENFWYLKSLFVCYVLIYYYVIIKCRYKLPIAIITCILAFPVVCRVPIVSSWKIDFMLPFFVLGLILSKNKNRIENNLFTLLLIAVTTFIILWIFWQPSYVWYESLPTWFRYGALISHENSVVNISCIYPVIYRYIIGTAGSLSFILSLWYVFRRIRNNEFLTKVSGWGGYSLHIYILQSFLVQSDIIPISFPSKNLWIFYGIYTLIYSIIIFFLCLLLAKFLSKNKYINRFIFGKQ